MMRFGLFVIILIVPVGLLLTAGLVYLIVHLTRSGGKEQEKQEEKKELDKMRIEDL